MARIKIIRSATSPVHAHIPGVAQADIPFDHHFHDCPDALLGALDDSDVEYEIENVAEGSSEPDPAAGGTDGLGGSPVPLLIEGATPSAGDEANAREGMTTLASISGNASQPVAETPEQTAELAAPVEEPAPTNATSAADAAPVPPVNSDVPGPSGSATADPLDHDGDGKKGGSKPRRRAAKTA